MIIKIKALDTLFFRDGKPFERGDESWADGIFPPSPSVFYGALRSWWLSNNKPITDELIEKSGEICIKNIYFNGKSSNFFPMPLDLVEPKQKDKTELNREKRKKTYQVNKLVLQKDPTASKQELISNYPLSEILIPRDKGKEVQQVSNGIITDTFLKDYLQAYESNFEIKKLKDFIISEPKVGIGLDNLTGTVEEGKLYRTGMSRLNGLELLVEFEVPKNTSISKAYSNILKLGGESKTASFRNIENEPISVSLKEIAKDLEGETDFKIYLATPAIFKNGYTPNLDKIGIQASLISAVIGKPLHLGGFDIKNKKPKPMRKVVPAGSVYYYKSQSPLTATQIEEIINQPISDFNASEGFGIKYIGKF